MKWVKWPEGPVLDSLRFSFSFACQLKIFSFSGQTLWEFHYNLHFWFICAMNTKTQTHSFSVALQYIDSAWYPWTYCIYLIIILKPHTCLSLIRKHPRQVWTSFLHSHLYIYVYYVFMLNTKTCIMKAADLSCSSGLHCSRYTILSQPSEPKRVWTWQREIFIACVKRVRKDDTPMNLNSQFNSTVKCFFLFLFYLC